MTSRRSSTEAIIPSFDGANTWPSVVAANAAGELRFGLDAATVRHEPGGSVLRSFERLLNDARTRQTDARTLTGLTTELAHLRTAVEALAESVKRHEEQLRKFTKPPPRR